MSGFRMSVIEYLRNNYSSTMEWWFDDNNNLISEATYNGRAMRSTFTPSQLADVYSLFISGGFYSGTKQPIWQRELDYLINGG